jgi:hypothetical protein
VAKRMNCHQWGHRGRPLLNRLDISLAVLYEPIMNAMAKAKKAGKVRFPGISTHRNEPEAIPAGWPSLGTKASPSVFFFLRQRELFPA